jgi:hypothetical protein
MAGFAPSKTSVALFYPARRLKVETRPTFPRAVLELTFDGLTLRYGPGAAGG